MNQKKERRKKHAAHRSLYATTLLIKQKTTFQLLFVLFLATSFYCDSKTSNIKLQLRRDLNCIENSCSPVIQEFTKITKKSVIIPQI